MATCHFARTKYKGRAGNAMAGRRVAYITRTGEFAPVEARIRHQDRETGTEHLREDLVASDHQNLPVWAHDDAVRYFSAAEQHTSPHQIAYEEWKIALPRELNRPQQLAAARDFLHTQFGTTHPHVWAMHDPVAADGGHQPHVHVIWSSRTLDAHERTAETFFRRYNRTHPERGGAEKAREFSHMGAVKASRVLYTDIMNMHLAQAGHEARLHPDKLALRGFDREPEPRLTVEDSNKLKHKQQITDGMQKVFDHRAQYAPEKPAELAEAQQYWRERIVTLGIAEDMDHVQRLDRIRQAREHAITHAPVKEATERLAQQAQELQQDIGTLETYGATLRLEYQVETAVAQRGHARGAKLDERIDRLLAQGQALGIDTGEDEPITGPGLRVRLYEKDKEEGYGR